MSKKTATYTIEEDLVQAFDSYCKKNLHNKSAVVESVISKWLEEKRAK